MGFSVDFINMLPANLVSGYGIYRAQYPQVVCDRRLCQFKFFCQAGDGHPIFGLAKDADELVSAVHADYLEAIRTELCFGR